MKGCTVSRESAQHRRTTVRLRGRHDGTVPPHPAGGMGNGAAGVPRGVIVLLGLAGAVVAVAGLKTVSDIIGPVFLALMLTVTASPLSGWLRRRGAPVWAAATALLVTVYLVLIGLGGALLLSATRLVDLLPQYQDQFTQLRADVAQTL